MAEHIKDILAILVFLLLFPYFALSLRQQLQIRQTAWTEEAQTAESETEKDSLAETMTSLEDGEDNGQTCKEMLSSLKDLPQSKKYSVRWEDAQTVCTLPVELFLVGALSASIDADYETEALKAQVVVLRSTLCQAYAQTESEVLALDETSGKYDSDAVMQEKWGERYAELLEKCVGAVLATQGIYASYDGKPINGCYHGMSCGKTRPGSELSQTGEYAYLKQVDCIDSMSAPESVQQKKLAVSSVGVLGSSVVDESGYVIQLERDGEIITGEKLREELGLLSSCFTWTEEKGYYIFQTKGNGHGFGLDQYYADVLAKKGMGYQEILDYFYADISLEKME
jgi:stage II sporulation protein D